MAFEFRWETRWRCRDGAGAMGEWDRNLDFLAPLGGAGWELVTVVPRTGRADDGEPLGTESELWVFKRPLRDAVSSRAGQQQEEPR